MDLSSPQPSALLQGAEFLSPGQGTVGAQLLLPLRVVCDISVAVLGQNYALGFLQWPHEASLLHAPCPF